MKREQLSFEQKSALMKEKRRAAVAHTPNPAIELHYSVQYAAHRLGLSSDKMRGILRAEPGVVVIRNKSAPHKRGYETLRVPESVLQRVIRRMSNV
jgi:hypothetical protein